MLHGIDKVCEQAGVDRAAIAHVLHGTTVATNAILEGKGATAQVGPLIETFVLGELARRLGDQFVAGIVLYAGGQPLPFGDRLRAWPISALWTLTHGTGNK